MRLVTAPGEGGIAVIAVPAGEARALDALFGGRAAGMPAGAVARGWLTELGRRIDEALVWRVDEGFEVGLHGGGAAAAAAMRALRRAGAHDAAPSTGASIEDEAASLLPSAATLPAAVFLSQAADGALVREVKRADESRMRAILARAPAGVALAYPRTVVLAGPPNAGKSTLLNALVGRERALVHEEAGTTRDPVEAIADFEGYPVRVVDTAGVGDGGEWEGEALRRMNEADVVVWLIDPRLPEEGPQGCLRVSGKSDLGSAIVGLSRVSGRTGEGLAELKRSCLSAMNLPWPADPGPAPFNDEGRELVQRYLKACEGRI